jgi:hypothetical protein
MLPSEQYSGDAVPQVRWTPEVWRVGPDALVAQAQEALWGDRSDVVSALGGGDPSAMSGDVTQPEDDSVADTETVLTPSTPLGRGDVWNAALRHVMSPSQDVASTGQVNPRYVR